MKKWLKNILAIFGILFLGVSLFFLFLPYGVYIEYHVKFNHKQAWAFVATKAPIEYVIDASETDQGAVGNGKTIKAFVDAIGSTRKATIKVLHTSKSTNTIHTLTTSKTISTNIELDIDHGAIIDGTGTLTINGPFEAGLSQCFGLSITVIGLKITYPQWWGALGDNSHDDTAALQASINATKPGGMLRVPTGIYLIDEKLTRVQGTVGVSNAINIVGYGFASHIRQTSTTKDILYLDANIDQISGWSIQDIAFSQVAGATTGNGIMLRKHHRGLIKNVLVGGCAETTLTFLQCICNTIINFSTNSALNLSSLTTTRPTYGIKIDDVSGVASNQNIFIGGEIANVTTGVGTGIFLTGTGRGNQFYGMTVEANNFGINVGANQSEYIFRGVWLESNTTQYSFSSKNGVFEPTGDAAERWILKNRARVHKGSAQSIPNATETTLTFDLEDYDYVDVHPAANNNRLVANVRGLYQIDGSVQWAAGAAGIRLSYIYFHDTSAGTDTAIALTQNPAPSSDELIQPMHTSYALDKDDYVEIKVYHNQGVALNVQLGHGTQFSMSWIGEYI